MEINIRFICLLLCLSIPVANANITDISNKSNIASENILNSMPNYSVKYSVKVFEKKISNKDSKVFVSGIYNDTSPFISKITNDFILKFFGVKFSRGKTIETFPPNYNTSNDFNIMNNSFIVSVRKKDYSTYEYSINEKVKGYNNFLSTSFSENIFYKAISMVGEEQSIRIDSADSNYHRIYIIKIKNI
ncbi:TPA: hypothetical protein ACHYT2_002182 [Enterobacter hormaechei]